MLQNQKATTHKGRKVLESRAPQVEEHPKKAMFVRGKRTGTLLNQLLKDLYQLKKPLAIMCKKHNDVRVFEDAASLEFLAEKNNASLFALGLHSKKRPHIIIMGRLFDGRILDMMELIITESKSMMYFKGVTSALGIKSLFLFNGSIFEEVEIYGRLKNLLLDFFHGEEVHEIDLASLDRVISVTAVEKQIYFRTYALKLKKSGTRLPRVELEEMGPCFDFALGRSQLAEPEVLREALKVPRVLKVRPTAV
jgi:ribosome production factor 2